MITQKRDFELVANRPVLKCFYQGDHSHPVRRTGLILEETPESFLVYELREGRTVRSFSQAKRFIRTYWKSQIARYDDYCRLRQGSRSKGTTLQRMGLLDLIKTGV